MQITLPEELKEWCYYDLEKFSYKLKDGAPKEMLQKFQDYKDKNLKRFKL